MNDKLKVFIQTKAGKRHFVGAVTQLRSISLSADVPAKLDLIRFELTYYLPTGVDYTVEDGFNFSSIRIRTTDE